MKVLIFIIATIALANARPGHQLLREFHSKLVGALGLLPEFDDPLRLNDTTVNLSNLNITGLDGIASIADSVVTGLSSLTEDLKFNLITLNVNVTVTVPQAAVSGQYTADASYTTPELGKQQVTGSGAYAGYVKNLRITGGGKLQVIVISNRVRITRLHLGVTFDEVHANGENAAVNGELIDWDTLNPQIKPIFDKEFAKHYDEIIAVATDVINEILGRYTLAELIEIILG